MKCGNRFIYPNNDQIRLYNLQKNTATNPELQRLGRRDFIDRGVDRLFSSVFFAESSYPGTGAHPTIRYVRVFLLLIICPNRSCKVNKSVPEKVFYQHDDGGFIQDVTLTTW